MCPQAAAIGARGSPCPWPAGRCPPPQRTNEVLLLEALVVAGGPGGTGRGGARRGVASWNPQGGRRHAGHRKEGTCRSRAPAQSQGARRSSASHPPCSAHPPKPHPLPQGRSPVWRRARDDGDAKLFALGRVERHQLDLWGEGGAVGARRVAMVRGREEGVLAAGCRRASFLRRLLSARRDTRQRGAVPQPLSKHLGPASSYQTLNPEPLVNKP